MGFYCLVCSHSIGTRMVFVEMNNFLELSYNHVYSCESDSDALVFADYGLCSQGAHARIEGSLIEKVVVSGKGLCHNEVTNPHNSTPLTPAVQSLM